ncbi:M48 family metallopeptidase [Actinoallomurus soli]|uniref:M48 family metallopeptidase n=1 Tax=Actinoallomurus soli TaxID=2952535 RepID=UPI002092DA81|nr:M48 family metallopeptidase [Actinoallomurus soli]MCO5966944.1 M48 family metalloprotease [Actinoallomurus soli]
MLTTFRAAVAVVLLAGFYVLVAVITVGTVFFDFYAVKYGHAGGFKVAALATFGVLAMLRGVFVVGRRRHEEEPGVAVSPRDEPELWRTVAELAHQVRTRVPDEIRLVPDVNAAVSENTRLLGLIPGRRSMYIGIPLMLSLTADEMRAVLCHELGHYSGSHTRLGGITYRGRTSLIRTIEGLRNHAVIRTIFLLYATLYLRVSQAVSRRQELEADAAAVAVSGRRPMGDALRKVRASAAAWNFYLASYCSLIGPAQARPADLFAGFYTLLREPGRQEELAKVVNSPEERSPYDSHPSLAERLAAIATLPEPAARPDSRPALALLADPQRAALATQASMLTEEALRLPVLDWPQIVERGLYTGANAEAMKDVFTAAAQAANTPQPTVDTVLRILAGGGAGDLGTRLRMAGWQGDDTPALVARVVARAFEGLLIQAGRARYVFSWSDIARLRDADGAEVDLTDLVRRAVDDPGQVNALYEGLLRVGITPVAAPVPDPAPTGAAPGGAIPGPGAVPPAPGGMGPVPGSGPLR